MLDAREIFREMYGDQIINLALSEKFDLKAQSAFIQGLKDGIMKNSKSDKNEDARIIYSHLWLFVNTDATFMLQTVEALKEIEAVPSGLREKEGFFPIFSGTPKTETDVKNAANEKTVITQAFNVAHPIFSHANALLEVLGFKGSKAYYAGLFNSITASLFIQITVLFSPILVIAGNGVGKGIGRGISLVELEKVTVPKSKWPLVSAYFLDFLQSFKPTKADKYILTVAAFVAAILMALAPRTTEVKSAQTSGNTSGEGTAGPGLVGDTNTDNEINILSQFTADQRLSESDRQAIEAGKAELRELYARYYAATARLQQAKKDLQAAQEEAVKNHFVIEDLANAKKLTGEAEAAGRKAEDALEVAQRAVDEAVAGLFTAQQKIDSKTKQMYQTQIQIYTFALQNGKVQEESDVAWMKRALVLAKAAVVDYEQRVEADQIEIAKINLDLANDQSRAVTDLNPGNQLGPSTTNSVNTNFQGAVQKQAPPSVTVQEEKPDSDVLKALKAKVAEADARVETARANAVAAQEKAKEAKIKLSQAIKAVLKEQREKGGPQLESRAHLNFVTAQEDSNAANSAAEAAQNEFEAAQREAQEAQQNKINYHATIQNAGSTTDVGGIDFNAANLAMLIKRDGRGVPLPVSKQNIQQLLRITGFDPEIIRISPATNVPIISEIQHAMAQSEVI